MIIRNRRRKEEPGFTLLEVLIVVAIIIFLATFLISALGALTEKAKRSATQTVLENISAGLADYWMQFREYPSTTAFPAGFTPDILAKGSDILYYYLTTSFSTTPDKSKGEVKAAKNVGPFLKLDPNRTQKLPSGNTAIIDGWRCPIHYSLTSYSSSIVDPNTPSGTTMVYQMLPLVYAYGGNKDPSTGKGVDPNWNPAQPANTQLMIMNVRANNLQ